MPNRKTFEIDSIFFRTLGNPLLKIDLISQK